MTVFRPERLDAALGFLAEAPATLLAGGTDVFPALGDRPAPARVLDLTALADLKGITREGDHWRIGAGATWAELCRADLPPLFDGLKAAGRQVGSVQIQTTGTIAGNICNASPAADGVPVLLTLDASVELASAAGRRVVPLAAFVTGNRRTARAPDEIVTAILVPQIDGAVRSDFAKLGSRAYLVISIVSLAAVLRVEGDSVAEARIAVGACSAVPLRLAALERDLVGRRVGALGAVVRPEQFAALVPIDDVRGSAAYRRDAVCTLAVRMLDGWGAQG
ncbi:FAD binding domain-containing protein [Defluviimonas sp. WL0024]|uniref:FAD binding domain-containing protein n=2 Tax=Albidovulum TaxID=205889 RepID=A0ABT3J0S0_9RHOB|nr:MULTISPECIES: FAD binding domain-containing protein [Defluviimonas]MCU9847026.1 FAD binding domain-containing protein [Defluviimonas sp. WL0024]MCW3781286.1 FAD binding domain-containing protein [Defluviimonas salinarum]